MSGSGGALDDADMDQKRKVRLGVPTVATSPHARFRRRR